MIPNVIDAQDRLDESNAYSSTDLAYFRRREKARGAVVDLTQPRIEKEVLDKIGSFLLDVPETRLDKEGFPKRTGKTRQETFMEFSARTGVGLAFCRTHSRSEIGDAVKLAKQQTAPQFI